MIAQQLSHSDPGETGLLEQRRQVGRVLREELGRGLLPPHVDLVEVEPAARTKMRVVRLLTLGLRMLSVFVAIRSSSTSRVLGERSSDSERSRACDEQLDRVREVALVDVVVAALDAQPVRLEKHVRVRVAERRLEPVRRELDEEAERVVEVDRSMKPRSLTPECRIPCSSSRLRCGGTSPARA